MVRLFAVALASLAVAAPAAADATNDAAARACGASEAAIAQAHAQADLFAEVDALTAVHERGAADAPVRIVELFDYVCPGCKAAHPSVNAFMDAHEAQAHLTLVEFPIWHRGMVGFVMRNHSDEAAANAVAASAQGKGLALHDAYLGLRGKLTRGRIEALAEDAGLDMERLSADAASEETTAAINANLAWADAMGVEGTPGFFVNGIATPGWSPAFAACMIAELRETGEAG